MNLLDETRIIFKKYGITANKSLGQNFLIDEEIVNQIIEKAEISKEDLIKDYLFSNFANINGSILKTSNIDGSSYYVSGIDNASGETMSDRAKSYLITKTGVSESTLNSIISILVG